ncbi:MAG: hypothetical protein HYX86_01480 [Chloroflexi bacterium]|nr:hypothetical protein [Chloroflexota bacterium]
MAKKTRKVFLPKWQRWAIIPLLSIIWLFLAYLEFFSATEEKVGTVGFILLTLLFLGMGIMFWLMSEGKLPAYIIEEEEDR